MTHKALAEILTKYADGRQTGARIEIPPSLDTTLFVAFGDEGLVVDRVRAIELGAEFAVASTSRGDRYIFLYEDVRAVRFGSGSGSGGPAGYER
ncbi:MAG TPA: hypothetical protein VK698_22480 [Kofleriaceae bacterium]|nr:hypothetical protein [Kofleriaceae bacterium]